MKILICGDSYLAEALARGASVAFGTNAAIYRQRSLTRNDLDPMDVDLTFAAVDVLDHFALDEAHAFFSILAVRSLEKRGPLILVSQVPPGTTRKWAGTYKQIYYQADTLIMKQAVARAASPEQFIIGCAEPDSWLPLAYQQYLLAHGCPVRQMSYESAELAKLGINCVLAKQISTARILETAASAVGADYNDVRKALHGDARIGPGAYLHPGELNQHLARDVITVDRLVSGGKR